MVKNQRLQAGQAQNYIALLIALRCSSLHCAAQNYIALHGAALR
jgi:hypothetical protein